MQGLITFAVVGHNEAATLAGALQMARVAADPGDSIVFVDSGSTDRSAEIAAETGVRRIPAPLGKGRAVARAFALCTTEYICLLDADIVGSSHNIPALLADAARSSGADMVVGDFDQEPGVLSNTVAVYEPLIKGLFPEIAGAYGSKPLSGFRVVRPAAIPQPLSPGFGLEAHFNTGLVARRGSSRVCRLGHYTGRFLYKPRMGLEIADAVLDMAVSVGRLDASCRPAWDRWVQVAVAHIATYRGDPSARETFASQLTELALRPLPPTRAG